MENWKDIKGYEGRYQVSDLGRVKSLNYNKTGKERIKKAAKGSCGYVIVTLSNGGKLKGFLVHRLVAEAFLPNPDRLPQVNHKDEDKTNNAVSNLEWCDRKYNINYGTGTERMKVSKGKTVYQYTMDGTLVCVYPSAKEAGRQTGYAQTHISACCRGKQNCYKGFIWSCTLINNHITSLF